MKLRFAKMHGLGNDFVVIDGVSTRFDPEPALLAHLADRRRGVGCDQILVVEPPSAPEQDFDYRIFNADGSEVGQCGNGVRCMAHFIRDRGLSARPALRLRTCTTVLEVEHLPDGQVRANMGLPRFEPAQVPFKAAARAERYTLTLADGAPVEVGVVGFGNPHAVLETRNLDAAPVEALGAALQAHPAFPERVNVGFLEVQDRGHARLRVFERGAGETQACGSGACAAGVIGRLWGQLDAQARVALPGGVLVIEWQEEGQPVFMTGPATTVFEGELEWPNARRNEKAK